MTYLLKTVNNAHGQADPKVNLAQDALLLGSRKLDIASLGKDACRLVKLLVGLVLAAALLELDRLDLLDLLVDALLVVLLCHVKGVLGSEVL